MSTTEYTKARHDGLREAHALQARGESPVLPVLSEIIPRLNIMAQVPLGLMQIPLDQIEGTATKGRTTAFSRSFLPLLDPGSEFASKWSILYDAVAEEGLRQPVVALEYYNKYYIVEGNKRVSVMRCLDAVLIEADVTRVMPEFEDSERYRVYQEFLQFYDDTKLSVITLDHEGDYKRLCQLTGHTPGQKWTAESLFDFQSCYYRFTPSYAKQTGGKAPMSPPNAFLVYLEVFGYEESIGKTPAEFARDIERILPEFRVAAANKPAALLNQPTEKPTLITSVKSALLGPGTLRCAFLYNSSPDDSSWTYWHELGRKTLKDTFGARVETVARENVPAAQAQAVMEELIAEGADVIFAASPVFLDACIRQSAAHPQVKILNCSLLASYHNVRSYYLRIYEAKFVLGAIAGAMAENDLVGYIADYPIYGTPASINAFALGAQTTNPRAQILLDWTTLPDHDPERALAAQGVRILSSRDIRAPHMDTHSFGLYCLTDDGPVNLAMPVWNWARLYQGIVRSVLTDAWAEEDAHNADRALSYYMGMSTDAIDILCSKRLPQHLRRLVELLHERIRSGVFLPFVGPLRDQDGALRVPQDTVLTPQEIIRMDYLAENVVGRMPAFDALSPVARGLVALQGVGESAAPQTSPDTATKDKSPEDQTP